MRVLQMSMTNAQPSGIAWATRPTPMLPAAPDTFFNSDRLTEGCSHLFGNNARPRVRRSARGEWRDDGDWPRRIGLSRRTSDDCQCSRKSDGGNQLSHVPPNAKKRSASVHSCADCTDHGRGKNIELNSGFGA